MVSQVSILLSALIIGFLGIVHLFITFVGNRIEPRDNSLKVSMQNTHPIITRQTTMWRAWIGFNSSHSMGAILFGCVYGYLSIQQPDVLFGSYFLLVVGFSMLLVFVLLAKRYWFNVPLIGIGLSLVCYMIGVFARFA